MRQKKLKGIERETLKSRGVITDSALFSLTDYKKVNLEIGSGKGLFITSLALYFKDELFIALEKNISVCYRILEKKINNNIDNLIIILDDALYLPEYFKTSSVDRIYLNFSDPWPKSKHHKRRLTSNKSLETYYGILKNNGQIQFRTDHLGLFDDSLEYFNNSKFKVLSVDYDLKESEYMTEYEIKKRSIGKIYQLTGVKNG